MTTTDMFDTFIRPCLLCGTTIRVVNGQRRPHECQTFGEQDSQVAYAWWQGHDAAKAAAAEMESLRGWAVDEAGVAHRRLNRLAQFVEEECEPEDGICHGLDLTDDGGCALATDLASIADAIHAVLSGEPESLRDVRSRHVVGDDDHRLDDDELERLIRAFSEPDEELGWRGSKSLRLLAHEIAGYIADHYSKPLPMAERDALRAEVERLRAGLSDLSGQYDERVETLRRTEAALAEQRAQRIAFTKRLEFGDDVTEPAATLAEMADPIEDAFTAQRDHFECPIVCELCGETLANTACEHCHGSGCTPNAAMAYSECEWCAGAGKVHPGCVEKSYANLAALLVRVVTLADQWDAEADASEDTHPRQARVTKLCALDLRAALSGEDPTC